MLFKVSELETSGGKITLGNFADFSFVLSVCGAMIIFV